MHVTAASMLKMQPDPTCRRTKKSNLNNSVDNRNIAADIIPSNSSSENQQVGYIKSNSYNKKVKMFSNISKEGIDKNIHWSTILWILLVTYNALSIVIILERQSYTCTELLWWKGQQRLQHYWNRPWQWGRKNFFANAQRYK